jgi:hypothetical protein
VDSGAPQDTLRALPGSVLPAACASARRCPLKPQGSSAGGALWQEPLPAGPESANHCSSCLLVHMRVFRGRITPEPGVQMDYTCPRLAVH